MSDSASPGTREVSKSGLRYSERLYLPWWWWPAAIVAVALLGHEIELAVHHRL